MTIKQAYLNFNDILLYFNLKIWHHM